MYTDSRCTHIENNFGRRLAGHADRNLAGWVLDMLADDRVQERGPYAGQKVCDTFIVGRPDLLQMAWSDERVAA